MNVVSINVGLPREVPWNGKTVLTGIFKTPVPGPLAVRPHNFEGDAQADLSAHGGKTKAVYAYPAGHYAFWRGEFPELFTDRELPHGLFGENLTLDGVDETTIHVGDVLRVGTAEFVVTEPRMPCFKLGIRFGRMDIVKRFLDSRRSGFYLSVARAGEVRAGDRVEVLAADPRGVAIRDVVRLYVEATGEDAADLALMRRALEVEALPGMWRKAFTERVAEREAGRSGPRE